MIMKKKLILAFTILLILTTATGYGILQYPQSHGIRTGKLVKLSRKGLFLKTYEGTLDLGSGDQLTWNFSVHNNELGRKLLEISGQEVKLHYKEHLMKLFYQTPYNVNSFEKISQAPGPYLEYFCQLVSILRMDKNVVEKTREMIEKMAPDLLEKIRECQK